MLASSALLLAGILLLLAGGYWLVAGASSLAGGLGVSKLFIGLTVVAFGTSAPELVVNVIAAVRGQVELSFGNVVGSNIANIGLVVGLAALLRPLRVRGQVIYRELPVMLFAVVLAILVVIDLPYGQPGSGFHRLDGLVLLTVFGGFLLVSVKRVLRKRPQDPLLEGSKQAGAIVGRRAQLGRGVPLALLGLIGLVAGGRLTVDGAVVVATGLGVSPVFIGLSVVAVGTSLPELATSVIAAVKGEADLAVGNIVGSNIFNLLFIMGTTALIRVVPVPPGGYADLAVLLVLSVLLIIVSVTHRHRILRAEGAIMLLLWIAYGVWRSGALG